MFLFYLLGGLAVVGGGGVVFLNQPQFGKLPAGERLARIEQSPNYRDGEFQNLEPTEMFTSEKSRTRVMWEFMTQRSDGVKPDQPVPAVKTDLKSLPRDSDLIVWFGHSSYLLQLAGKRILVDPVFVNCAPVGFMNKPFKGTDLYKPDDMPDIDLLIITHDHYDHLDYKTVKALKGRVGKVVCGLGIGAHLERWGYTPEQLLEMDWMDDADLGESIAVHCLPARHYSGRSLGRNKTLWASYLVETPSANVFIGGDSGYGKHFRMIGERFARIDWAILENGQYSKDWEQIHTIPEKLGEEMKDLHARNAITVHNSKFALARHRWDEPLETVDSLQRDTTIHTHIARLIIGEVLPLNVNNEN